MISYAALFRCQAHHDDRVANMLMPMPGQLWLQSATIDQADLGCDTGQLLRAAGHNHDELEELAVAWKPPCISRSLLGWWHSSSLAAYQRMHSDCCKAMLAVMD